MARRLLQNKSRGEDPTRYARRDVFSGFWFDGNQVFYKTDEHGDNRMEVVDLDIQPGHSAIDAKLMKDLEALGLPNLYKVAAKGSMNLRVGGLPGARRALCAELEDPEGKLLVQKILRRTAPDWADLAFSVKELQRIAAQDVAPEAPPPPQEDDGDLKKDWGATHAHRGTPPSPGRRGA
ncbi:MAG: hypothetical protein WDN72_10955 [Alphaproteobacteria bacterium]